MQSESLTNITIVIMAGGTGGHVFPALAVAELFISRGAKVHWLGTHAGIEAEIVPLKDIPLAFMNVSGVRGKGLMKLVFAPFQIVLAVSQAWSFMRVIQPNVVLGMGGFVSGPGGIAAKLSGIPLVIHEQNAVPGFTNKILARFADRVLQAFAGAFGEDGITFTVGNPVRKEFARLSDVKERYEQRQGALRVLVVGGSQGASALNEIVPRALALYKSKCLVRHQAGKGKAVVTRETYDANGLQAEVSEFIDDIAQCYEWADVVICRAGALTVSEIAVSGVAAIFVPYPFAVDDHQTKNANALVGMNAAVIIQEEKLSPLGLMQQLKKIGERHELKNMALNAKKMAKPDATEKVMNTCLEVARV